MKRFLTQTRLGEALLITVIAGILDLLVIWAFPNHFTLAPMLLGSASYALIIQFFKNNNKSWY